MSEVRRKAGTRATEQGATFIRLLTTDDSFQDIHDQVVSPKFRDVFDGEDRLLGPMEHIENISDGEMVIGSRYTGSHYIIQTPIKNKPTFGSAELYGLDLNLKHDKIC